MVEGGSTGWPSAILRMTWRRILPERRLRQARHDECLLEVGERTHAAPNHLHEFGLHLRGVGVDAVLEQHQPKRYLAPVLVRDADHRAFRHGGVRGNHLFKFARRQPVAGDVHHVVHPAHDVDVAVGVTVSPVAG